MSISFTNESQCVTHESRTLCGSIARAALPPSKRENYAFLLEQIFSASSAKANNGVCRSLSARETSRYCLECELFTDTPKRLVLIDTVWTNVNREAAEAVGSPREPIIAYVCENAGRPRVTTIEERLRGYHNDEVTLVLPCGTVNKERDTARVSKQISKLEKRVKQEIVLNQELLQDIKEEEQRRKKLDAITLNTNTNEKQKNKNDITQDKVLLEEEKKDTANNDKNAQTFHETLTHSSKVSYNVPNNGKLPDGSPIIPVLVFSCNRITVQRCLDQLIKYRPSMEQFPIIVSEDCQHHQTAEVIARYGDQIMHIQQPDQSDIEVPPKEKKFKGYFKIARHYGWALNHVFFQLGYNTVIIVEDDLDIAPDFFEYFLGTYPLLVSDNSLWCVSAWNDNGKAGLVDESASDALYRTDFFPGLGWMLTRQLWTELSPKWPKSYWDDWIRQPEQRRNRACIRPEISRTRTFGKTGVSNGMFYERHLKYIKLNTEYVHFTRMNLTYLLKDNYDIGFVNKVYRSTVVSFSELKNGRVVAPGAVRIPYYSRQAYKITAKQFGLMDDFRSGVPRTGYRGVVTFFYKGRRVHLAPSPNWNGYDITWS